MGVSNRKNAKPNFRIRRNLRSLPPTEGQVRELLRLGVPSLFMPKTRQEASEYIAWKRQQLLAKQKSGQMGPESKEGY
jgi:hypothetical protein